MYGICIYVSYVYMYITVWYVSYHYIYMYQAHIYICIYSIYVQHLCIYPALWSYTYHFIYFHSVHTAHHIHMRPHMQYNQGWHALSLYMIWHIWYMADWVGQYSVSSCIYVYTVIYIYASSIYVCHAMVRYCMPAICDQSISVYSLYMSG